MKQVRSLAVAFLGIMMAVGLIFAGCKQDNGCKGDGACYFIRSSNDYKWCGDESCAVWLSEDRGQASLSCNCN